MNALLKDISVSVRATLCFTLLLCGIFPLAIWGISQVAFRGQANGSLIHDKEGRVIGSVLLGQNFKEPRYFHPRPSAAGADGYDAASSSGSNLGPTSAKLMDAVKERVAAYRSGNGLDASVLVPGDAVTASASGLDPHISPRNAALQAPRVAKARGIPVEEVRKHIAGATANRSLGFLGEPGVNVLVLNLSLDKISPSPQ